MGDVNAVAFAQAIHFSLAVSADAVAECNIISLRRPLPDFQLVSGIVIDDHVVLEAEGAASPACRVNHTPATHHAEPPSNCLAPALGASKYTVCRRNKRSLH
ncbi:unnamed protein product [Polarella glacialis]|uniref:Uncharacterized protein n=1 Tax=Polarella glacialis TaxID=89957 RepID=A0A813H683_POLGL|nr:unnamed protein product [Polarella glacialis]